MGAENVEHGVYGTLMNGLGSCLGFCGAFVSLLLPLQFMHFIQHRLKQPCCPMPNPYREVQQGLRSIMCDGKIDIHLCTMQALWDWYRALGIFTNVGDQNSPIASATRI